MNGSLNTLKEGDTITLRYDQVKDENMPSICLFYHVCHWNSAVLRKFNRFDDSLFIFAMDDQYGEPIKNKKLLT